MCGIAGIWQFDKSQKIDAGQLLAMRDALAHRGPDDAGLYIDNNLGLAHRRLSIVDLSIQGHQPFVSNDGRYVIVFNGEIYNFRSFYSELKAQGFAFRSHSDTEVLLYLYQAYGPAMLDRLNGMFALAVWDHHKQELFVARDRMGVKPLYYALRHNTFYFASEPKALFSAGLPLRIEHGCWDEHLLYRFVAGENTLFKGVYKLLPGHYAVVKNGALHKTRWWNLSERVAGRAPEKDPVAWFQHTFDDSLRLRMISDVPVGIMLSGGLDSSSVASSLYHNGYRQIHSFNIGFSHQAHDESNEARQLSQSLGFPFHSIKVESYNLFSHLVQATYFADEPLVHQNDPHLLSLSRVAKQNVSVLLSGEGADEVLGGYVRYQAMKYNRLFPVFEACLRLPCIKEAIPRLGKLSRYIAIKDSGLQLMLNGSNNYPADFAKAGLTAIETRQAYRSKVLDEARQVFPAQLLKQLLYLDQHTYLCSLLDRNDRTTMGASIECREPFLDYRLVEGIGALPINWLTKEKKGKYLLKRAMKQRLPESVLRFRKIGLSVPWSQYFRQEPHFKDLLHALPGSPIMEWGILQYLSIKKLISEFEAGNDSNAALLQQLAMIHIWQENYVKTLAKPYVQLVN